MSKTVAERMGNKFGAVAVGVMRKLIVAYPNSNLAVYEDIMDNHSDLVHGHSEQSIITKISQLRNRMGMRIRKPYKRGGNGVPRFTIRPAVRVAPVVITKNVIPCEFSRLKETMTQAVFAAIEAGNTDLAKTLVKTITEIKAAEVRRTI